MNLRTRKPGLKFVRRKHFLVSKTPVIKSELRVDCRRHHRGFHKGLVGIRNGT